MLSILDTSEMALLGGAEVPSNPRVKEQNIIPL
jgi:hypothetical protein